MAIYGVCAGKNMKSYLCELKRTKEAVFIPTYNVTIPQPNPPNSFEDFHLARNWGNMQIILAGELEVGVSDGKLKTIVGRPGDIIYFICRQGDGYTTARKGKDAFVGISSRLLDPWAALSKAYTGWPDNIAPPAP